MGFHDWLLIFGDIVWEFETVVTNFPRGIWILMILAVGVYLIAQRYPENVNPSEYPEDLTPSIKVENADFKPDTLSKDLEGAQT